MGRGCRFLEGLGGGGDIRMRLGGGFEGFG